MSTRGPGALLGLCVVLVAAVLVVVYLASASVLAVHDHVQVRRDQA